MPLELSLMEESDIPAFVEVDDAAMKQWPLALAMANSDPSGRPRKKMIEDWVRKGFSEESNVVYVKVTDTDLEEMAAVGIWRLNYEVEEPKPRTEDPPAPAEANGMATPVKNGEKKEKPTIMEYMSRSWNEFKSSHFDTIPYANLMVLATHPKHQRRGAGDLIVKWGCKKADERGIVTCLTATTAGLGLYLKNGFEVVRVNELDLRPYGVDDTEIRRDMIRQPKAASK